MGSSLIIYLTFKADDTWDNVLSNAARQLFAALLATLHKKFPCVSSALCWSKPVWQKKISEKYGDQTFLVTTELHCVA